MLQEHRIIYYFLLQYEYKGGENGKKGDKKKKKKDKDSDAEEEERDVEEMKPLITPEGEETLRERRNLPQHSAADEDR